MVVEGRVKPTLQRVRQATKAAHEALEARVDMVARLRSHGDYVRLLSAQLGFYRPLEARLAAAPWERIGFDFAARRKVPLLEADLGALGMDAPERAALPDCQRLPSLPRLPAALGALYVVEGATLGGQLISRHVGSVLGEGTPRNFHRGYGTRNGAQWQDFQQALEAGCSDPVERDEAAAAALATFQALDLWLAERW